MSGGSPETRTSFDAPSFFAGLQLLDQEIGNTRVLRAFSPITMIASGGFVSVTYLRNRSTTEDLDYFLDWSEYGQYLPSVSQQLKEIIKKIADALHYNSKWCNDEVNAFLTLLNNPKDLFDRSIEQGTVLYRGTNLVIYAVLWEWVLVRKMKRLQMEGQLRREEDYSDCVAIMARIVSNNGRPISQSLLTQFDHTEREPPVYDNTIAELRSLYQSNYGIDPFSPGFKRTPRVRR